MTCELVTNEFALFSENFSGELLVELHCNPPPRTLKISTKQISRRNRVVNKSEGSIFLGQERKRVKSVLAETLFHQVFFLFTPFPLSLKRRKNLSTFTNKSSSPRTHHPPSIIKPVASRLHKRVDNFPPPTSAGMPKTIKRVPLNPFSNALSRKALTIR